MIKGSQPAKIRIRAIGPTLASFSVTGVLAQPTLTVGDASGNTVATNTGWPTRSNAAAIVSEAAAAGAFALPSGSADCALLLTHSPGAHTGVVSGVGGTSGIALAEAYQAPWAPEAHRRGRPRFPGRGLLSKELRNDEDHDRAAHAAAGEEVNERISSSC